MTDGRRSLRRRATLGAYLLATLALSALLAGCYLPGLGPTPTIPPEAKTAAAWNPTPTVRTVRTRTATNPPTPTRPARTPTPGPNSFAATAEQPCRQARYTGPIPEKRTTVETIGQAYRCLLRYYVDHETLDGRILLNGAWSELRVASKGRFTPEELAPLDLTGDREGDWAVFAARFTALIDAKRGAVDASPLARAAIAGMADSLKDNHVAYLEPKYWRRTVTSELGLEYFPTAGFEVAMDEETGKYFLYVVFPDSPAARAGLRPGDLIDNVGGTIVGRDRDNRPLGDLMVGLPGTGDTVQVTRPATGETLSVLIVVAEVDVPLIELDILEGQVGYVRLRYFSYDAGEVFDEAVRILKSRRVKSVIFDVRQNPGGSSAALNHILSYFTHEGPLAYMIDGQWQREAMQPDPRVPLLGVPWGVLCDGQSASSSDVTAAVAKARGGRLIGTRSAGALGGSLYYELEDGRALQTTVVRVIGPDGEEINEIGVTPHEVVRLTPADLSADNDPQLTAALAYLLGR